MKAVAHLRKQFARVVKVRASKRGAVINEQVPVRDIQTVQRDRKSFKVFAQRKVETGVPGQMIGRRIAVRES